MLVCPLSQSCSVDIGPAAEEGEKPVRTDLIIAAWVGEKLFGAGLVAGVHEAGSATSGTGHLIQHGEDVLSRYRGVEEGALHHPVTPPPGLDVLDRALMLLPVDDPGLVEVVSRFPGPFMQLPHREPRGGVDQFRRGGRQRVGGYSLGGIAKPGPNRVRCRDRRHHGPDLDQRYCLAPGHLRYGLDEFHGVRVSAGASERATPLSVGAARDLPGDPGRVGVEVLSVGGIVS